MDELLALMEAEPPSEETHSQGDEAQEFSVMNELVTLMEDSPEPTNIPQDKRQNSVSTETPSRSIRSKPVSAGIDDKLGIRMIDRVVSSVDLIDLISMHPHFTPASLSAMSLAGLSKILIDPPNTIDQATVSGKTNMVTVGIVFNNSGTKISSKGGAFCVLTIGNLVSGPCVSIFLFGEVYSKFCRTCVPGKVVALVNPKLLPVKIGSGTSISFAAYSTSQLLMVAKARDYGTCKATVRVKDRDGKWTAGGKCKNFIDKRICELCHAHRKQQNKSKGGKLQKVVGNIEGKAPSHFIQYPRHGKTETNRFLNLNLARAAPVVTSRFANSHRPSQTNAATSTSVSPRQKENVSNRLLRNSTNFDMQTKVTARAQKNISTKSTVVSKSKRKTDIVGAGDWLNSAIQSQTNSRGSSFLEAAKKKGKCKINTAGYVFDGSVQVPKPSRLFDLKTVKATAKTSNVSVQSKKKQREEVTERIRQNQAAVARRLKESISNENKKATSRSKVTATTSFYDSVQDIDLDKVRNAKGRFATEVEAEEYAKSRQKVLELEKMESSKDAKRKKGVKKSTLLTKTEKRTKLHHASTEEGGLRLGAGLEWSRNLKDHYG